MTAWSNSTTNFLVVPSLAEYWTISDDGKRITFYLRKGVRFHHGRAVTAEDVKFSLEQALGGKILPDGNSWGGRWAWTRDMLIGGPIKRKGSAPAA
jgi:ABC-type transport system substrate-binding protein